MSNLIARPVSPLMAAARHPLIALMGIREFAGSCGMSWADDDSKSDAYDFGRDLAHRLTLRRWDECS